MRQRGRLPCRTPERHARADRRDPVAELEQPCVGAPLGEPSRGRRGEHHDARGEDGRDDTRHVQLKRQERRLVHVRVAATLAARVIDRDSTLAALDKHHQVGEDQHDGDHQDRDQRAHVAVADLLEHADQRGGQARHDAGEDDQRDAVADAALGDLLADPHQEDGTGGQRDHGGEHEAHARRVHDRSARRRDLALQATLDDGCGEQAHAGLFGLLQQLGVKGHEDSRKTLRRSPHRGR